MKILFIKTVEGEEKDQDTHIFCFRYQNCIDLHKRGQFIEGFQSWERGGNSDLCIMGGLKAKFPLLLSPPLPSSPLPWQETFCLLHIL